MLYWIIICRSQIEGEASHCIGLVLLIPETYYGLLLLIAAYWKWGLLWLVASAYHANLLRLSSTGLHQ